jgi:signal transduction histidine kinase
MTNVARHARAGRVNVMLERTSEGIAVTLEDDGVGIADVKLATRDSYGIDAMRHRLRAVGGRVDIDSRPGAGTRVRAFIPQRMSVALDATLERSS